MRKAILAVLLVSSFSTTQASPSIQNSDINQIFTKDTKENSLVNSLQEHEMKTTKGEFWEGWLFANNPFTNPQNFFCQSYYGNSFCF